MTPSTPFFSIVIPSYNRSVLIQGTLDSVLALTFADYEVLVVDNCSTDDTAEVVASYTQRDARIQFYQNDQNYDRSYSRNRGIGMARGQYITLLDSDDFLLPEALMEIQKVILKNQQAKLFYGNYQVVDSQRNVISNPNKKEYFANPKERILYGNFLACIGVFVASSVFKTYLFDQNPMLIGSEDWELWIRIIHGIDHVVHHDKAIAQLQEHENRTMNQFNGDALEKRVQYIIEKHLHLAQKINFENEFLSSCYLLIGNGFQESSQIDKAWYYWKKAIHAHMGFLLHRRSLALLKNMVIKSLYK
jgi:glycosyltransferase involved in cell wall biosynthesis